jgi:non-canonical (house-cleaning) NTP pyrophosphatase
MMRTPIEGQGFTCRIRQTQVAVVDRVEGAAEQAERAGDPASGRIHRARSGSNTSEGVGIEAGEHHRDEDCREAQWPAAGAEDGRDEAQHGRSAGRRISTMTSIRPMP